MDVKEKSKSYFKTHPNVSIFHFTSDGFAFFNKEAANSHAQTLDDDKVINVERGDLKSEKVPEANPLEEKTIAELKELAKEKGVELEATKKADIIEELTNKTEQ